MQKRLIVVVQCHLSLERELMKSVEALECKDSLWSIESGGKPSSAEKLGAVGYESVGTTVAQINRYGMNP
jgi:hypothetical protein